MSSKQHGKHHPYCLNCHYPLSEFDKNCSQCGQKPTDGKTTIHDLVHEFVHTLFHLDGKFFWTLKHLFIPGKLTLEFFKGHHKRYAHPVQLFIVIGAFAFATIVSKSNKAEIGIQDRVEESKAKVHRKEVLLELDTVSKALFYRHSIDSQLRDSLMFRMIHPLGLEKSREELMADLREIVDDEIDRPKNKRAFKIDFKGDSIGTRRFKDSIIQVLINDKPLFKNDGKESGTLEDFKEGFMAGATATLLERIRNKAQAEITGLKREMNFKEAIHIVEDSVNVQGLFFSSEDAKNGKAINVPMREIYELSPDSIIEKYKITGFRDKIMAKQYIKTMSEGGSLFHFYMSKLFWATFAIIPILAGFFMLMYWRQRRFYVEHVLFLMHYNTTIFLGLIITLYVFPYWKMIPFWFVLWVAIYFYIALKNFYQQSWKKTFLKYIIITSMYYIIASAIIIITLVMSFLLF